MVQTIRVPGAIDLSGHRIAVGDTTAFVTKINTTQQRLEEFSEDLTDMVSDLVIVTEDIENQFSAAVEAVSSTASDLQAVQNLMDVSLSSAIDEAVEYISGVFSSEGSSKILNSELNLVAATNISKAAPVVLNDDGTVSPVGIDTGTVGALEKITAVEPGYRASIFNRRHSVALIAYGAGSVTNFMMLKASGGVVREVDSGILFNGVASPICMFEDQDGNLDVFFKNAVPDYSKYYTKIIITSTTATVQPLQNLGNLGSYSGFFEKDSAAGKFLFVGHHANLVASIISVNGTVATVDYSEVGLVSTSSFTGLFGFDESTGKFVVGYVRDSINYLNTITPDYAGSFTIGAELNVQGVHDTAYAAFGNNHLYFSPQVGKFLLCSIRTGYAKVRSLDTTATQVSLGLVSEFGVSGYNRDPYVFFDPIRNKHLFFWREEYGVGLNYCFADYENGSFNFGTPVVYDSSNRESAVPIYDVTTSSAVVFGKNGSNPKYGYSRLVTPAGTNAKNLLGVAKEAVLTGVEGAVAVKGDIADGFTDLVINSDYWVNEIGELSLLDTGLPKLGRALSSTSMLIEGR